MVSVCLDIQQVVLIEESGVGDIIVDGYDCIVSYFNILNSMKEDSNKKYPKYQNQSLMALTSNNQPQPTKKMIQPEDYFSLQPIAQSNHRLYLFRLPLETEVPVLVTAIATRFSNLVVHAQQDDLGAEIILQGLQHPGIRAKIAKVLDYFVFCCSKGLRFGNLQEVYNVILINIKKQVVDHQCLITVTNPYSQLMQKQMRDRYFHLILDPIQQQLKTILKNGESSDGQTHSSNPYLHNSSPTRLDIQIHKKIYDLFVVQDNKEYNRYKNIFLHSIQKIDKEIEQYKYKVNNPTHSSKKAPSPSTIIEAINKEGDSLLVSLKNTYKQDDTQELIYLHSLLASETAQTVSFYTIQETLCLYRLKHLKDIYYSSIAEQCEAFNKHVDFLNKYKTDQECFEHLTLKKKYRLPDEKKPYFSAIERLKLIENSLSLREALLVIQQTFSDVKTDCFVSHKGKVELASMDELLPVIIFVTVRAAIRNFPIYVMMIGDYIRLRGVFELQQRIMTAFYAAIEDVSRGWQLQQAKK